MEPYEIIAAPFTAWIAPIGEAFPLIDAAPAGNWAKIGTSGDENYSDAGVTVSHAQTFGQARPVGNTGARKVWRDTEDLMIGFQLWDMSLEQYLLALNGNAVTTTAAGSGTAGFKSISLHRGQSVATYALLLRGPSAYADAMNCQYQVPIVYQSASPKPVFSKKGPAGLDLEFAAIEDSSSSYPFGQLIQQHQAPLP